MAQELREHGIAALAVAPGFMRTERVMEAFRRAGAMDALDRPGGPNETPAYVGRAIVALASDPHVIEKSGHLVEVGTLAREYGFRDIDGTSRPRSGSPATVDARAQAPYALTAISSPLSDIIEGSWRLVWLGIAIAHWAASPDWAAWSLACRPDLRPHLRQSGGARRQRS